MENSNLHSYVVTIPQIYSYHTVVLAELFHLMAPRVPKLHNKKKERKMTKLDFHHFQVRRFNVFELSWCHCRVGATLARRSDYVCTA